MATKKKSVELGNAADIAIALWEVRQEKKKVDAMEKNLTTLLKDAMHKQNLKEAGDFELSTARTLKIEDEKLARPWATANHCLVPEKIDTSKAKEILRHTFDDPSKFGFAIVESERIVPKGKADEE